MKIQLQVTEITHDDIVDILDILLAENDFCFAYNKKNYKAIAEDKKSGTSLTDKVADCLLNGYEICITDLMAEEEVHNEKLKHEVNDDGSVDYYVTLDDFKKGLSQSDALDYVSSIIAEQGDYWTSYALIQYVLFGEEIYG